MAAPKAGIPELCCKSEVGSRGGPQEKAISDKQGGQ